MGRIIPSLLFVVSLLISKGTMAQVRLGVKAGANASNLHLDAVTFDPLVGYQAGLMADLGLSSHFSIQPSLVINSKGSSTDLDIRDQNGQREDGTRAIFRLIYAEIPVLFLYKGSLGESWRWYGGVGPYVGIGITGKFKTDSDILEDQKIKFVLGKQSNYVGNVYKRMDYGLNAALGWR
ncbi:porin family protein [Salmonirosea aquatica]|uniref:Outer membrane beta-barrel protein n=1 Tax=Salmonirosea aquatica TaxID=2654236 RepID=A0A7C9B7S5_9BACT|nr:outer membrane beta-barrel protein [Cytophagaceae bacterium SJW1-29]